MSAERWCNSTAEFDVDVSIHAFGCLESPLSSAGLLDFFLQFVCQADGEAVASQAFTQQRIITCRDLVGDVNPNVTPVLALRVIATIFLAKQTS